MAGDTVATAASLMGPPDKPESRPRPEAEHVSDLAEERAAEAAATETSFLPK